jgi:hypothetical protein
MDHIGAILADHQDAQDAQTTQTTQDLDIESLSQLEDGFDKLKHILSQIACIVSQLTCKKSLADGRYGMNRFHGVISFQSNKFIVQYVNEASMGFETLVRVYDYTYNEDQLFVTKFKNPKRFAECIQEQEEIFLFDEMVRWRWEIRNVCKCCNLQDQLTRLEGLATEIDKMTARSRTKTTTN